MCLPQLKFWWWFWGLQWHSVFDESMRQPWIYFCYQFYASVLNSLTLSIPYVSFHLVLSDDFKVYSHSVFADDFRSVVTQCSLTIPRVHDDSFFSIDFMRQSWISFRCRFHASSVAQISMMISRSTLTQLSLMIYKSAMTVFSTIPCVSHDPIFLLIWCVGREFTDSIDSIHQLSLSFQCRF
jgi:hypothetical protein